MAIAEALGRAVAMLVSCKSCHRKRESEVTSAQLEKHLRKSRVAPSPSSSRPVFAKEYNDAHSGLEVPKAQPFDEANPILEWS